MVAIGVAPLSATIASGLLVVSLTLVPFLVLREMDATKERRISENPITCEQFGEQGESA